MATVKSDDDSEEVPHPLAQDRPGVYVHVAGSRGRRKKKKRVDAHDLEPISASRAITAPGETVEIVAVRESGTFAPKLESLPPPPVASENTNHRADLMVVNLPAPPRVPNMSLTGAPLTSASTPEGVEQSGLASAASLLDAPHSLRPDSLPVVKPGSSWLLLGGVAALTSIIAAALVVALREPPGPTPRPTPATSSVEVPPGDPEPAVSGFAPKSPLAEDDELVEGDAPVAPGAPAFRPATAPASGLAKEPPRPTVSAPREAAKPRAEGPQAPPAAVPATLEPGTPAPATPAPATPAASTPAPAAEPARAQPLPPASPADSAPENAPQGEPEVPSPLPEAPVPADGVERALPENPYAQ